MSRLAFVFLTRGRCFIAAHGSINLKMQGEKKERWRILCEQAAVEQDRQKLMALIREIDQLLEEKQERLNHNPDDPHSK
jgi:hypothetical protein